MDNVRDNLGGRNPVDGHEAAKVTVNGDSRSSVTAKLAWTPRLLALKSPGVRRWVAARVEANVAEAAVPTVSATSVRKPWVYRGREEEVAQGLGGYPLILPYTDIIAKNEHETDIDHVVPLAEALRSGANGWSGAQWEAFQSDPCNLTLASPKVNRQEKGGSGIGEWVPVHNRTWYALDYAVVKLAFGLSFTKREAAVIREQLLHGPT